MPRKPSNHPTDAELAILQVLWESGPCTVREVHEQLTNSEQIGYTTVLKTLQIMAEKDLVRRDESQRAHVYAARRSEEQTQQRLLGDLLERAYRGSAGKMVMQALSARVASRQELDEIRTLLDRMSGEIDDDGNQ
jgi:predicted transcriptional regulator